jgi:large subunit ribosomal protein L24
MKMKIRKGDRVRVMRGDKVDKNKVGEVIRVIPKENRVVVQGVNLVKKHQRQQQTGGGKTIPSGIREFEAPIHASNVMVVDREGAREARASRRAKAEETAKPAPKRAATKKESASKAEPKAKATEAKKSATKKAAKADEGAGKK